MNTETRERLSLIMIVMFGVAVRLVLLLRAGDLDLYADEGSYAYLALLWNRFGFYSATENYLWPPIYPAFVALFLRVFGESGLLAAKAAQVALSGIIGAAVVLLARQAFSERAALIAGVIWATYLPLAAFTHYLWPETLFLSVYLPGVLLYWRALERPDEPGIGGFALAAAGLLLGLALLVKQSVAPLILVFTLVLIGLRMQGSFTRRLLRASVFLLSAVAVVLPWALRNQEVYGRVVYSGSTLGQNFFMGINGRYHNIDYPHVVNYDELYDEGDRTYRWLIRSDAPEWQRSEAPNIIDRSSENVRRAWEFAANHASFVLRSRIKRLADWVTPTSFFVRHFVLEMYRDQGVNAPGVRRLLIVASISATVLVLIGAIPGLFWALSDRMARIVICSTLIAFMAAIPLVAMSRYRLPVEPLLIVLTAGFLAGENRGSWRRPKAAALVVTGWFLLGSLWLVNWVEIGAVLQKAL